MRKKEQENKEAKRDQQDIMAEKQQTKGMTRRTMI